MPRPEVEHVRDFDPFTLPTAEEYADGVRTLVALVDEQDRLRSSEYSGRSHYQDAVFYGCGLSYVGSEESRLTNQQIVNAGKVLRQIARQLKEQLER